MMLALRKFLWHKQKQLLHDVNGNKSHETQNDQNEKTRYFSKRATSNTQLFFTQVAHSGLLATATSSHATHFFMAFMAFMAINLLLFASVSSQLPYFSHFSPCNAPWP